MELNLKFREEVKKINSAVLARIKEEEKISSNTAEVLKVML